MNEIVVVAGCRTAIGTAFKGSLVSVSAFELAEVIVSELVARTGLEPGDVDDVVLGEAMYGGGVIARHAALAAGLTAVPGLALNRHCASSLAAVSTSAANIAAGMQDVVIAGGAYSQSSAPRVSFRDPRTGEVDDSWLSPPQPVSPGVPGRDMSVLVGWGAAAEAGISRVDMDQWALESHRKAVAAIDDGRFAEEIVPLKVSRGDMISVFEVDEHPRRATTLEKLTSLKPLHPEIDGFSITAGNSSGLNDGAAGLVLMSADRAAAVGHTPLAKIRSWTSVGIEPERTGMAPCEAIPKALARAGGMTVSDVDLWEINEAFASVPMAASRMLGIDPDKINPVGSGCSLGHPIAATGARMTVSLVHELQRRGGGIAVAAMCAAGGMGSALVLEVLPS